MDDQDLRHLYSRFCDGDPGAGETLLAQVQPRVWSYLRMLGRDDSTADDLTQETCMKMVRTRTSTQGRYHPDQGHFVAWMLRIARNTFLDFCRHRGRVVAVADPEALQALPDRHDRPGASLELRDAIDRLPDRQREAVELKLQGFSHAEIAQRMGVALGTVGSTLDSALQNLRALWQHEQPGPAL